MISVIVPVYNVEPYLRQCIDSILAQNYTDFELILVDDGSSDNCSAICDGYAAKDSRIRVFHQENAGVSAARNAGITAARGEYIAFIDSDDWVVPTYLNRMYMQLIEHNADISVCGMQHFEDDTDLSDIKPHEKADSVIITGRDACLSIYRMDNAIQIVLWGKLYKRSLFDGISFPVGRVHEDDATTPRVLYRAKKISVSSAPLYAYRQRKGSIMHEKFSEKRFDTIYAIDSCISFFHEVGDFDLQHQAEQARQVMLAKLVVRAKEAGIADKLPRQYAMSEWKALRIIRSSTTNDVYSWFLSLNHPRLVRPYAYIVKIKQILGMER